MSVQHHILDPKMILKTYFGYDSFKKGQEEVISALLRGRDVMAVMPTGSGKSVCYQIPALMMSGLTLVISPLISLMQDQVKSLEEAGINAGYVNSMLSEAKILEVYSRAGKGEFKILYVAPERLDSEIFMDFALSVDISMVCIDEAHCVSQWGQDFRPSYLNICTFVQSLKKRPVIGAFTATATKEVKTDIELMLRLNDPITVATGFDRENLFFSVEELSVRDKARYVLKYVKDHPDDCGIIYCSTRKNVDTIYAMLIGAGIRAARYHAGMDADERRESQDEFVYDRANVIVATNAFGMGIDKSNVRFVIHFNMPQCMENYYQEAGRAGRDGEPSQCILLFSGQDVIIDRFLLEHKDFTDIPEEDIEAIRQRDQRRLRIMENYCKTTGCLRNYILSYFGENRSLPCENCSNCQREFTQTELTQEAKQVINCVYEAKGRYGVKVIVDTLLGRDNARLKSLGTIRYRTYGALKGFDEVTLRQLLEQMINEGYLVKTEDQYPVLKMGDISPLKDPLTQVVIRTYKEKEKSQAKPAKGKGRVLTEDGYVLLRRLRELRYSIAKYRGVPPYVVFGDRTLMDIVVKMPTDEDSMLEVSGVGEVKMHQYGKVFIDAVKRFKEELPGVSTCIDHRDGTDETGADPATKATEDKKEKKAKKTKRPKTQKPDFYINVMESVLFEYKDLMFASEISDELNRISSVADCRKCRYKNIWEFFLTKGYVRQNEKDGETVKEVTKEGYERGVVTEVRTNSKGEEYTRILYPPSLQKEAVEAFVKDVNAEEMQM